MVPEATVHPISRLIQCVKSPVVRRTPKDASVPIVSTAKMSMNPNGYESFCRCSKVSTLKAYLRYRLDEKTLDEATNLMTRTMRDTEMFDGKKLTRSRKLTDQEVALGRAYTLSYKPRSLVNFTELSRTESRPELTR